MGTWNGKKPLPKSTRPRSHRIGAGTDDDVLVPKDGPGRRRVCIGDLTTRTARLALLGDRQQGKEVARVSNVTLVVLARRN
jgi:hypothetical protein